MNPVFRKTVLGLVALSFAASLILSMLPQSAPSSPAERAAAPPVPRPWEQFEGSPAAPVTVIEYASLGCSHCAEFRTRGWEAFKAAWLDTGKVRLIQRDFPLDRPSLRAAAAVRCVAAADKAKGEALRVSLFRAQRDWMSADQADLDGFLARSGFDAAASENAACLERESEEALRQRVEGERVHGVKATPSFFIGSTVVQGNAPEELREAIERALGAVEGQSRD